MHPDVQPSKDENKLSYHIYTYTLENAPTAINADTATSQILEVPAGEACLMLERRTWRGKANVTAVRQVFVGTTYDLIARFTSKNAS